MPNRIERAPQRHFSILYFLKNPLPSPRVCKNWAQVPKSLKKSHLYNFISFLESSRKSCNRNFSVKLQLLGAFERKFSTRDPFWSFRQFPFSNKTPKIIKTDFFICRKTFFSEFEVNFADEMRVNYAEQVFRLSWVSSEILTVKFIGWKLETLRGSFPYFSIRSKI